MRNHDDVKELLLLAAAGVLGEDEECRVRQHVALCATCSHELEVWRAFLPALAKLPAPVPSAHLTQRTLLIVKRSRQAAEARRWNNLMLAFLVAFSWAMSAATWPVVHLATGAGLLPWMAFSTLLGWVTVGCAAVIVGLQTSARRRNCELLT